MKIINIFLFITIITGLVFAKSNLSNAEHITTESFERYFLSFDKNPDTYYNYRNKDTLFIDFYNTTISPTCVKKFRSYKSCKKIIAINSPTNILSLKFIISKKRLLGLYPLDNLFVMEFIDKDYKRLWKEEIVNKYNKGVIGPQSISLFQNKKRETLKFVLNENISNTIVNIKNKSFSVEFSGIGTKIETKKYKPNSKFIKKMSYTTTIIDSLKNRGVTYFDFKMKKKYDIKYEFKNNILNIIIQKG